MPLLEEGLPALREALPATHWRIPAVENSLGACLAGAGRYDEAEQLLVKSCTDLEAVLGPDDYRTRVARQRTAGFYQDRGRPEAADEYSR
ncbi:MAG: tetratricopeptide repeat protein [bacterium]|nr:tetratricopeptide repeat protein [bacterium]